MARAYESEGEVALVGAQRVLRLMSVPGEVVGDHFVSRGHVLEGGQGPLAREVVRTEVVTVKAEKVVVKAEKVVVKAEKGEVHEKVAPEKVEGEGE